MLTAPRIRLPAPPSRFRRFPSWLVTSWPTSSSHGSPLRLRRSAGAAPRDRPAGSSDQRALQSGLQVSQGAGWPALTVPGGHVQTLFWWLGQ